MRVIYNGRTYEFRECDPRGVTQEALQKMADATGRMQYELRAAWLVIPGIGYGWEARQ